MEDKSHHKKPEKYLKKKKVSEGPRIKMHLSLRRVNSKNYGFWYIRVTPSPLSPMFQPYYEFQKDLQKPRLQGLMSYLALMMEHSKVNICHISLY